ncbi:MAG: hypothetical protein F4X58_01055 [Chloroflexi bacterium]|nr:hypothetical protein [Chloroflexota bacterium]MYC00494.1 hypothetical protein [Chloroflexota bacterium]
MRPAWGLARGVSRFRTDHKDKPADPHRLGAQLTVPHNGLQHCPGVITTDADGDPRSLGVRRKGGQAGRDRLVRVAEEPRTGETLNRVRSARDVLVDVPDLDQQQRTAGGE